MFNKYTELRKAAEKVLNDKYGTEIRRNLDWESAQTFNIGRSSDEDFRHKRAYDKTINGVVNTIRYSIVKNIRVEKKVKGRKKVDFKNQEELIRHKFDTVAGLNVWLLRRMEFCQDFIEKHQNSCKQKERVRLRKIALERLEEVYNKVN